MFGLPERESTGCIGSAYQPQHDEADHDEHAADNAQAAFKSALSFSFLWKMLGEVY